MHARHPTNETKSFRLEDVSHDIIPKKHAKTPRYKFFFHLIRFDFLPVEKPNIAY